jgi:hypothetical protein
MVQQNRLSRSVSGVLHRTNRYSLYPIFYRKQAALDHGNWNLFAVERQYDRDSETPLRFRWLTRHKLKADFGGRV